jgi:hypothetical protein
MAVLGAVGMGAGVADQRGVMRTLLAQPFGKVMLLGLAVGLSCYTLWFFIQAIFDPEGAGTDWKGAGKRIGYFVKGIIHVGLVLAILRLMIGLKTNESTDSVARDWTAWVMSFPAGIWMVAGIGVGVMVFGIYQLWRAWGIRLDEQMELGNIRAGARRVLIWVGRFGLIARGVLFGTMGIFLIVAAMRADPKEAKGVAAAMKALEEQRYGSLLLAAVALGLFAYGVDQFLMAKYRRIGA